MKNLIKIKSSIIIFISICYANIDFSNKDFIFLKNGRIKIGDFISITEKSELRKIGPLSSQTEIIRWYETKD